MAEGSETVRALVAEIALAFPNRGLDERQYIRDLSDVPVGILRDTVGAMLRTSRDWPPSVGDVREAAAAAVLGIPDEMVAHRQINQRIAWARQGGTGDAPELHPLAREAVSYVGGWHALRTADRPEVVRGQMLRWYREARQSELRAVAAANMSGLASA